MKGLLIKDFKLIKFKLRYIIAGAIILSIVFYINRSGDFQIGGGFLIAYFSFVGMMTATRTVSLDHNNNSSSFLFSLPFTRRTYALEKYVFIFSIGIICFILSIIVVLIICYFKKELNILATLTTALAVFAVIIFMVDIMIPIELRFGSFVSRFALVVLVLSVLALALIFASAIVSGRLDTKYLPDWTYPQLLLFLYCISGITTLISYKLSEYIIKRKEF